MFRKLLSALRPASPAPDTAPAPSEQTTLPPLDQLRQIREMLWDTGRMFSISKTQAQLDEIEATLDADANTDTETRGELAYARAYLYSKQGFPADTLAAYQTALSAHAQTPFLTEKQFISARYSLGLSQEDLQNWEEAIAAYTDAIPAVRASDLFDDNQLGGLLEKRAFCLHEAGRYDEALTENLSLLDFAKGFMAEDDENLCGCLINIAQNLHALKRPDEARPYLERVLENAATHANHDRVVEMRFQLGVLAFEGGDTDTARTQMTAGHDYAQAHGDDWLKERAVGHLSELEERAAAAR